MEDVKIYLNQQTNRYTVFNPNQEKSMQIPYQAAQGLPKILGLPVTDMNNRQEITKDMRLLVKEAKNVS